MHSLHGMLISIMTRSVVFVCCLVVQDVGQTVSYRRSDPKQPEGLDPIKKERVFGEKVGWFLPSSHIVCRPRTIIHS